MKRVKRARARARRSQAAKRGRSKVPKAALRSRSTPSSEGPEVARLTRELNEAREQPTATSEILRTISSSPSDLQPVFETMLEKAVRICDAMFGNIYRWDGHEVELIASHNIPVAFAEHRRRSPYRPNEDNAFGRMIATKTLIHAIDAAAERAYTRSGESQELWRPSNWGVYGHTLPSRC